MTGLVDRHGQPLSSIKNKKKAPPATGEKYGSWAGEDVRLMTLPGGGAIQFDLNQLTIDDFRQMKDHYQINSSLSVLTFLMHQMEWRIECPGPAVQKNFYQDSMEEIWTPLVRAKSQAFWAGYSPNVLQWENDTANRKVVIDKVKDLLPEDCLVRWKTVDGAPLNPDMPGTAFHKIKIYDGIKQLGSPPIPVDNSYWYPLLMENGDYYGRKLMRPAFQSWFFSILLHLFANRYYERFGEPTPVGRAPYDDTISFQGADMRGNQAMEIILNSLRNRSTVVLPNDKTPFGDETSPGYDYTIEYLESQMRGADFERYMTRLDEEMSLALFTPILLMRTADVGSYNLGTQHSIIYQWMLNAIAGDWKRYIDKYLLRPMRDFAFGENAPMPKIVFRKMGAQNADLIRDITRDMITKGSVKPDITQLGEQAGLTLTEVEQLTTDPAPADPAPTPAPDSKKNSGPTSPARNVAEMIGQRVAKQVNKAFKNKSLESAGFDLGYNSHFNSALADMGYERGTSDRFYSLMQAVLEDMASFGTDDYVNPEDFMIQFRKAMFIEIDRLEANK